MLTLFTQFAAEAAEEKSGLAVLALDPKAILIQAGTFLLLFLIIKKFALAKIIDALESRRKTIEEGIENAHKMQELAEKSAEEQEKILRKTHQAADVILAKAHEEAGSIVQDAQDKAQIKAEQMLSDAHAQLEQDLTAAKQALKGEMLGLVATATETILHEKIDQSRDRALIERALKEQV